MKFSILPDSSKSQLNSFSEWTLVVAVNQEDVFEKNLLTSPDVDNHCQVIRKLGYSNAASAYNSGIAEAENEIVVFAHQDVYLPQGWLNCLKKSLEQLDRLDPKWGVLGVFGVVNPSGCAGHVYSTGLHRTLGASFERPIECRTLDEMLLIIRRSSGLRFDQQLPGFHLYGSDICLEACDRSLSSYVIPAFCIHNSNGMVRLPWAFWKAYLYLRRKWSKRLPISTSCTEITKWCVPFIRGVISPLFSTNTPGKRIGDPERLFRDVLNVTSI